MDRFLQREMSISHEDFFRLLPGALGDMPFTRRGSRIEAGSGSRRVDIEVEPESRRRLVSLELPVTRVSISLSGFEPAEETAFLARFDLTYQRGGG